MNNPESVLPSSAVEPFRGHLRRQGWDRLSHGLYLPSGSVRAATDQLRAWSLVLPRDGAFTHLTAAELRGWWLPGPVEHPVFAAAWNTETCVQRDGLRVSRHREPLPVEVIEGIRATSAAQTLLAAARDLSMLDLVVLGDSALHLGQCTLDDLSRVSRQRRWGAPRLRQVVPLLDRRSESPWESILRLLHWAADVAVEPQKEIVDAWGRFVARADLWVVGTSRLHEYDGELHRDRDVHRTDLARDRRLVEHDWQRVGFVASQLLYEAAGIIAMLDRLLNRPWDPRRLARWQGLLNASLLRPSGRSRTRARWSLP